MNYFIDVGSAPPCEDCASVGTAGYHERAKRECRAYIGLLRRALGNEPIGARLSVKENPHDLGDYLSVICHYDEIHPDSVDYAFRCESEAPEFWDTQARLELAGEGR